MDEAREKAMLNCGLNVFDNDSMSMFEDCPNNELLELLKTKKHARMFLQLGSDTFSLKIGLRSLHHIFE